MSKRKSPNVINAKVKDNAITSKKIEDLIDQIENYKNSLPEMKAAYEETEEFQDFQKAKNTLKALEEEKDKEVLKLVKGNLQIEIEFAEYLRPEISLAS